MNVMFHKFHKMKLFCYRDEASCVRMAVSQNLSCRASPLTEKGEGPRLKMRDNNVPKSTHPGIPLCIFDESATPDPNAVTCIPDSEST